jgi:hypothetical protein
MLKTRKKIGTLHMRAQVVKSTLDKEARTIDVTFATDTPVRMMGWEGWYDEILSFEPGHVRMERLQRGAPVLDNHARWEGTKAQLGKVEKAWIEQGKGGATLRFSKRASVEEIWQDIEDEILTGISVGYRVYSYEKTEKPGEVPTYRAIDWEPFEISMAPVQADINSAVRADNSEQYEVEITDPHNNASNNHKNIMNREAIIALLKARGITVADDITDEALTQELTRALNATPVTTPPVTPPAVVPVTEDPTRAAQAVAAERTRSTEILAGCRKVGLTTEFAEELIASDKTLDQARAAIIEKFAAGDPNQGQRSGVSVGVEDREKKRDAMANALILRADPGSKLVADAEKVALREYRGMSLVDMAKEHLETLGVNVRGLSKSEVASMALNNDRLRMHSTSDFPIILGNTINRVLRAEYDLARPTFREWATQATATDFREKTIAQFGEVGDFKEIKEGGEYQETTLGEAKESYRITKYGRKIAVTWESIVNDDLSAFSRIPRKIADAATRKQSDIVYALLAANPEMGDGVALFHANHGNLGTAGAISVDALGEMRKKMRNQKGIDRKDFLNLTPSILLVGPNYEQLALQFTSQNYVAALPGNQNVWAGMMRPIVEARITGNAWYGIADRRAIDTLEFAFLEGEGELFTEMRDGFDIDGVEIKARMTFGAKFMDHRGIVKNVGA